MENQPPPASGTGPLSETPSDLENLSIIARCRRFPRFRVLVNPLFWTKLQVELLGCTFTRPHVAPPTLVMRGLDSGEVFRPVKTKDGKFSESFDMTTAVLPLLYDEKSDKAPLGLCCEPELNFGFGAYRDTSIPVFYFYLRNGLGLPTKPPVAYLDSDRLASWRRERCSRTFCASEFNSVGRSLAARKWRKLRSTFTEPLHDPYLVAVLIALAQEQWRAFATKPVTGVISKVLYSSEDTNFIHLYTANISSEFIRMLRDPFKTPSEPQHVSIRITAIPYEPHETLRDRLWALILSATSLEEVGTAEDLVVYKEPGPTTPPANSHLDESGPGVARDSC
ncbi:hypothetical protein MAC_04989 [Metarhizium acridum CQMa 102]|uniref:Uncharacterized protein n=1 Tax=Metarhizium acridum (strain CQMa 102) TaxID=655827 RepID=E9E5B3_METAQ|nr:uncharacterized protein MAC_04989 [Metarhizium acridum CQMa 102]EFY88895.1 hypothetical protein MAC_04989 [Metarhizium acridum CQMa 102]